MTSSTADEDVYFWGMFKKKLDNKSKKEKIIACPHCGSKRIHKVTLQEPVFVNLDVPFHCEDCGYQGKPREFDSEKEYELFVKKLK
jgi:DNA-directed RNA polymerase subunit RPC12/RpoP